MDDPTVIALEIIGSGDVSVGADPLKVTNS